MVDEAKPAATDLLVLEIIRNRKMAYTLQSLIHTLNHINLPDLHHHQNSFSHFQIPLIECLLKKAISLKDSLENWPHPMSSSNEFEILESKIRDAAHEAEDITESVMVAVSSTMSTHAILKVINEFESAMEVIAMKMTGSPIQEDDPNTSLVQEIDPSHKDLVVGLDLDLFPLRDRVIGDARHLEIIPIVGMPGLGKTTLARQLYYDPLVVPHFDTRAWVTVAQDYNFRKILLDLLGCVIGKVTSEMLTKKTEGLAVDLHQALIGRRFLIVSDDMWSAKVFNDLKQFFPDDKNRSRIVLTTRELDVANYVAPTGQYHRMRLLNKFEGWRLLRHKVFAQESCSPALEKIGRKIVGNCRGLPLAITVIAGLLSSAKENQKLWEEVARDTSSIVNNKVQFSRILSLSYEHLPSHLKPCFLYFGVFPEDSDIRASKLIALWVAEGFLKPIQDKSLEEVAEVYLKSLVDRNLISVHKRESEGMIKSYGIHDLLRDFCVKKAAQEKFLYIKSGKSHDIPTKNVSLRRVSIHPSYRSRDINDVQESMQLTRSLFYIGHASSNILWPLLSPRRLLRVLDVLELRFSHFPEEILQLINLRFLAITCLSGFPPSISCLRNLQILICNVKILKLASFSYIDSIQDEFWNLPQLRSVKFKQAYTWLEEILGDIRPQKNLQAVSNLKLSNNGVVGKFPNLRKLGIVYDYRVLRAVIDLSRLAKLETLKCSTDRLGDSIFSPFLSTLRFPSSLKNLSLCGVIIPRSFMSTFGSLLNLQVLKLRHCTFRGSRRGARPEWEVGEGEFPQLQFLLLEKLNLCSWKAEEDCFTRLQHLVIRECSALEVIPGVIGGQPTLEIIEVDKSSNGAAASAKEILEEQRSEYGNYDLQVLTHTHA